MSDLDEKLAPATRAPGVRATATFKQLQARWGEVDLVHVNAMGEREVWRHVQGRGLEAIFERLEPQ